MDALSDPRDPSKWSSEDLITMGFVHTPELMSLLDNTPKLGDLTLDDYDAVMVAGGLAPMFTFRDNKSIHDALRHFYEAEKPTCIYCHGTAALVDLKLNDGSYLVAGKTVTGFSNGEEDYSDAFVGQKSDAFQARGRIQRARGKLCPGASSKHLSSETAVSSRGNSNTRDERSRLRSSKHSECSQGMDSVRIPVVIGDFSVTGSAVERTPLPSERRYQDGRNDIRAIAS